MGIKVRTCVCTQVFFACFVVYMLRVCLSVNIMAMVTKDRFGASKCVNNSSSAATSLPNFGPRYNWKRIEQGILLGSYYVGYFITCLPGDYLAETFGGMLVVLVSTVCSGTLTALIPFGAKVHVWLVIFMRFLIGLASGVVYPAIQAVLKSWAPPTEGAKFGASLMGNTIGTVVTYPLAGVLTEKIGWIWAFIIPGAVSLVWCVIWFFTVADAPSQHPFISAEEHQFISDSLSGEVKRVKAKPPYKDIFTNIPFWALTISHFASMWCLSLLLNNGPMYVHEVFGFNLYVSGALASLPHLARVVFGHVLKSIGDVIVKEKVASIGTIRKVFTIFSHIIPGLLMLTVLLSDCDVPLAIILIVLSLGLNGAATVSNLQNFHDLSPVFAATLFGIVKSIDSITGFITPCVTAVITVKKSDLKQWNMVYAIGGGMYIVCGLIFIIFGSGKKQSFNNVPAYREE